MHCSKRPTSCTLHSITSSAAPARRAATLGCVFMIAYGGRVYRRMDEGYGGGALHAAGPHAVSARQIVFELAQPFAPGQPQCIVRPIRPGCVPVPTEG